MLNPFQNTDKENQAQDVETPQPAHRPQFLFETLHVVNPKGNNKEGQVTEQKDQPGCTAVPPGIFPGESVGCIEKIFDKNAEGRTGNGNEPTVGNAEYSGFFVWQQKLRPDNACHGEHEHDLDVQSRQNYESASARRAPDGRIIGNVKNETIPDFVEPVHAPKGQSGQNQIPVTLFDFNSINIKDKRQQRNNILLKVTAASQNAQDLFGRFRHWILLFWICFGIRIYYFILYPCEFCKSD